MLAEVIKLENESSKIYEQINKWFKELGRNNRDYADINKESRTAKDYEADVRLYFHLMKGKQKGSELEYLIQKDIEITQDDMEEYVATLCDLKDLKGNNLYVNKTINRKVTALKGLIRFLKRKKFIDTDISYLELINGEKERRNSYGVLEPEEVLKMAELAGKEKVNGDTKRLLIMFAFKTGLRISELVSLNWNSLIKIGNEIFVKGVGKGNEEFKIKISNDLYEDLQILNKGQDQIFQIAPRRVTDMMDRLKNKLNIQPERQIVFHSIRKCFGTLVWRMTGDIEQARRALRHKDVSTTQIYLGIGSYELDNSIFSIDKIDEELYKKVTLEQLMSAISTCPKHVQLVLNVKLNELLKENN